MTQSDWVGRTLGDRYVIDDVLGLIVLAIVSAIAIVDLGEEVVRRARLALTGGWREHVRLAGAAKLLVGQPLNHATIEQVKDAVEEEVSPQDDFRGTAVYRRAVAGVLTRRALIACMERGSQQ